MEGNFVIRLGDKPVGTAQVRREGLYFHFICRCRLDADAVCRVTAGDINLGVLVPGAEGFVLDTKLPVKQFPESVSDFRIEPSRPVLGEKFIPIYPEEPFGYISRLKDAYLARRDGQTGAVIKEKAGT